MFIKFFRRRPSCMSSTSARSLRPGWNESLFRSAAVVQSHLLVQPQITAAVSGGGPQPTPACRHFSTPPPRWATSVISHNQLQTWVDGALHAEEEEIKQNMKRIAVFVELSDLGLKSVSCEFAELVGESMRSGRERQKFGRLLPYKLGVAMCHEGWLLWRECTKLVGVSPWLWY